MIEITICLAVIGFALVAIIGILPYGLNVQKENRQETIIKQDADVWMSAIRNGQQGLDDLTNYVMAITNYYTIYDLGGRPATSGLNWYTPYGSSTSPRFPLTNGFRIIGLLSTPKLIMVPRPGRSSQMVSNHVVALVRSLSGAASEKYPQTDNDVRDLGLNYRMIPEVLSYGTNLAWLTDSNSLNYAAKYGANLHDLRLTFRWPLLPNGNVGPQWQVFRTLVGGQLLSLGTNGLGYNPTNLYFFQPNSYQ